MKYAVSPEGYLSSPATGALASADFNEDGIADLAVGRGSTGEGQVSLHLGNYEALWPYSPESRLARARGETIPPFLPEAVFTELTGPADFVAAGDFDNDGHADVIAGSRGGHTLHLFRGDGSGALTGGPERLLPGSLSGLVQGEVNRVDGILDLVVAVSRPEGGRILVFEGPHGVWNSNPESFDLPSSIADLALGEFDSDSGIDLMAAAGDELVLVRGRDRKLSSSPQLAAPATRTHYFLPFTPLALAAGNFTSGGPDQLAVLDEQGIVHLLSGFAAPSGGEGALEPAAVAAFVESYQIARLSPTRGAPGRLWSVRLLGARDQLLGSSGIGAQVWEWGALSDAESAQGEIARTVSLPGSRPLAGALPMRLGRDGLLDLVTVSEASPDPHILPQQGGPVFMVTNTNDSGPGSLRQAIEDANQSAEPASIEFAIPGPGPHTISPITVLPAVLESLTIDGFTQPGSSPNTNPSPLGLNAVPMIELDGSQLTQTGTALSFLNVNSVLRGVVVNRFPLFGGSVLFYADGNFVEGNFVGTSPNGRSALPNGRGVTFAESSNNLVGGTSPAARNLMSGNDAEGLIGFGGAGIRVEGNLVGTDIDGESALGNNLGVGFFSDPQGAVVGGTMPGAGNVVSGNRVRGVRVDGGANHLVTGNRVGTNGMATSAIPNAVGGVLFNRVSMSQVGGTAAAAGNVISSNTPIGVYVYETLGGITIQGNLIGTDGSGFNALPGAFVGIDLFRSPDNLIGGTVSGAPNTISGNATGIIITRPESVNNTVQGNRLGTALDGVTPLPNTEEAIAILNGAGENLIGGVSPEAGNVIAYNRLSGVAFVRLIGFADPGNGNYVTGNQIHSNGLIGIDFWEDDGVTLNDPLDADEGPNRLQNFPRLDVLEHEGGMTHLLGALESAPNTMYSLEFFSNTECDETGFGEGRTPLGRQSVTTDASGRVAFQADFPGGLDFITATATDSEGNTSEFSRCAVFGEPRTDLVLEVINPPDGVIAGGSVSYTFQVTNKGPAEAQRVFVDTLIPDSLTITSSVGCLEDPGVPSCSVGDLQAGSNVQFTLQFDVSPFAAGSADMALVELGATVGAQTAEAAPGDEYLLIPLSIQGVPFADLALQASVMPDMVASGLQFGLTLTVTNNGPDPVTGVKITNILPDGLEFVAGAGCKNLIGTVTCQLPNLANGEMSQIALTVAAASQASGALVQQLTVSAAQPDPDPVNNSVGASVTVILRGDLNGDGELDGTDVADFLKELNDGDGQLVDDVGGGEFAGNSDFDVDFNGQIDQDDLILLASLLLDKPLDAPDSGEQIILGTAPPLGSVLDFPRLTFAPGKITGVAVVNPTPEDAEVMFTAYDQNGEILSERPRTIGPGVQLAELTFEIFGTLDPNTVGWFRATSDTPGLTGFFLDLDGSLKELDGADLPVRARRIIFNKIRVGSGFSTELNIVNSGNETTTVELSLVGGASPIHKVIKLPPLGLARLDAATFFGDQQPAGLEELPAASYVLAEGGQALVGFEIVASESGDFEGLNARSALDFLNTIYIPQMAVLGPFESTVGLVNYSQQPVLVTLTAHQADGKLFAPQFGQNPVTRALGPGGSLLESIAELFGFEGDTPLEGWLEIVSTGQAVNGYFSYRLPLTGASAAVAAASQPRRTAIFSHLATIPGFFTGVALLNPGSLNANYRILALSAAGELLGNYAGVLRPHQRISRLITDLIESSSGRNGGLVFVRSNVPLFSTALFGTSDVRVLANIPPQPVPAEYAPDSAVSPPRVTPTLSVLGPGGVTQFQAQNLLGTPEWRVNGQIGGSPQAGLIDANGKYTAPIDQPEDLPVTITAETQSAVASASIDVLTPQTVLQNLGVVASMSFVESLDRLYSAEIVGLGGASFALSPGGSPGSQIYWASATSRTLLVDFPGEEIRKLITYRSRSGKDYLLASAAISARVLRIDPANGSFQAVAQGLDGPDTMVLDPVSGDLLLATATEIVRIARDQLEVGIPPAGTNFKRESTPGLLGTVTSLEGATGIGVDRCTGNLIVSQGAQNRVLSISPGGDVEEILPRRDQFGAIIEPIFAPNEVLVTYRSQVACPESTQILFIEEGADRVSLYVPSEDVLFAPWVEAPAPSDLILVPASDQDGPASVLIEQGSNPGGEGPSEIVAVDVSDIFDPEAENPPLVQPASVAVSPPGPDLAVPLSSAKAGDVVAIDFFYRPGAQAASMLVLTLDYDEDLLELASGELSDSVLPNLPGGVQLIGFHDPRQTDRELGFLIVDPDPPTTTLEGGNLFRLFFSVKSFARGVGDIRITAPGPQLIDAAGSILPLSEAASGGVTIRP